MITQSQLLDSLEKTFQNCLTIARAKNNDYAGSEDALRNFAGSTIVGVPLARGILVRMMDKIVRVSNLLEKEPDVVGESVTDSLHDLINYAGILKAHLDSEFRKTENAQGLVGDCKLKPIDWELYRPTIGRILFGDSNTTANLEYNGTTTYKDDVPFTYTNSGQDSRLMTNQSIHDGLVNATDEIMRERWNRGD